MGTAQITKTFAGGPVAIVRVENVTHTDEQLKRMCELSAGEGDWPLQAVNGHIRDLGGSTDAHTASGALYGTVDKRVGVQVGVTSGREIEVYAPVMFTVSIKEAGVEKARVTAKARPGMQRS